MKYTYLSILSAVLLPISSSAMFQSQADVWQALSNMNKQPTTFDISIEGTADDETFAIKGSGQAEGTNLTDAKALFSMQLMATDTQMGDITANMEFKLVNQVLYVRGQSNQSLLLELYGIDSKQWLAIPLQELTELDTEMEMLLGANTAEMEALALEYMPRIFTMESRAIANTYEYTLSPKEGYIQALMELGAASLAANGINEDVSGFNAEVKLIESMLADILTVQIVIRASAKDEVIGSNISANINDDDVQMSVSLQTEPLQIPSLLGAQPVGVQVFAPAKNITRTLEEVYGSYEAEYEWTEEAYIEGAVQQPTQTRNEPVSNEWSQMEAQMAKQDVQYLGRPSKRSLRASVRR